MMRNFTYQCWAASYALLHGFWNVKDLAHNATQREWQAFCKDARRFRDDQLA